MNAGELLQVVATAGSYGGGAASIAITMMENPFFILIVDSNKWRPLTDSHLFSMPDMLQ